VLIVLEGIDGAGTTTQARLLAEALRLIGKDVHVTKEPTPGPVGSLIRQILGGGVRLGAEHSSEILALLFAADRLDHLARAIEPHLAANRIVISDRYDLSSVVYQVVTATAEIPTSEMAAWLVSLNRFARRPDVTVVLDVPAELAAERLAHRGGEAEIFDELMLQRRLAVTYRHASTLMPDDRIYVIDGTSGEQQVTNRILRALEFL
jgi:dTMP kinase